MAQVPTHEDIERVIIITTDALRWDQSAPYREAYPPGTWFRGTSQATYTPASHASMFTSMNPPRTGVIEFGDVLQHPNIFTQTNSISTSGATDIDKHTPELDASEDGHGFIPIDGIEQEYVGFMWMKRDEGEMAKLMDLIPQYDVIFAHDWMVHSSEIEYDREWSQSLQDLDEDSYTEEALSNNEEAYEICVERSRDIHETFFEELQDAGLYEDTLFIMWGDHGQGLGHPPVHSVRHCNMPTASSCRVPIGFCSPLFETTEVDTETNARGVDIWPTLTSLMDEAAIPYEPMPHSVEGVDLTEFDGELYGYSNALSIRKTGFGDAVTDAEHIFLDHDMRKLMKDTQHGDYTVSEPIENDFLMSELDEQRRLVRREPSTLVKNRTPDQEQMEAMGYL